MPGLVGSPAAKADSRRDGHPREGGVPAAAEGDHGRGTRGARRERDAHQPQPRRAQVPRHQARRPAVARPPRLPVRPPRGDGLRPGRVPRPRPVGAQRRGVRPVLPGREPHRPREGARRRAGRQARRGRRTARKLAFFALFPDATHICVADTETGACRKITKTPVLATLVTTFQWSPDGKRIQTVLLPDEGKQPVPKPGVADRARRCASPATAKTRRGRTATCSNRRTRCNCSNTSSPGNSRSSTWPTATVTKVGAPGDDPQRQHRAGREQFRVTTVKKPFSYYAPFQRFGVDGEHLGPRGQVAASRSPTGTCARPSRSRPRRPTRPRRRPEGRRDEGRRHKGGEGRRRRQPEGSEPGPDGATARQPPVNPRTRPDPTIRSPRNRSTRTASATWSGGRTARACRSCNSNRRRRRTSKTRRRTTEGGSGEEGRSRRRSARTA